jgi:ketosteroid isomerase-like protein
MSTSIKNIFWLALVLCITVWSCKNYSEAEKKILAIQKTYVDGWIAYDSTQIMSVFEDEAIVHPPAQGPVVGKRSLTKFWFPQDSSKVTVQEFEFHPLHLEMRDTIAILTYDAYLDYVYAKDTLSISQSEKSIGTTIFRKQFDDSWKIWRQNWTNVEIKRK